MPRSAYPLISWNGNSARAQQSFAIGTTSAARKARTRSTTALSSAIEQVLESVQISDEQL